MKSLKFTPLFFTLLLISSISTFAQSKTKNLTNEQKKELTQNLEDYFTALNLTEEQKPEFERITRKYTEKMKAVKDGNGRKLQKYKKVKAIRKNKNKEMKELLSGEQYETYLKKQEEMIKKVKEKKNN